MATASRTLSLQIPTANDEETEVRVCGNVSFDFTVDAGFAEGGEVSAAALSNSLAKAVRRWLGEAQAPVVAEAPRREWEREPSRTFDVLAAIEEISEVVEEPEVAEEPAMELEEVRPYQATEMSFPAISRVRELGDEPTAEGSSEEMAEVIADSWSRRPTSQQVSTSDVFADEDSAPVEMDDRRRDSDTMEVPAVSMDFGMGLDEESEGTFFSDIPVTGDIPSEHSHAAIKVECPNDAQTREHASLSDAGVSSLVEELLAESSTATADPEVTMTLEEIGSDVDDTAEVAYGLLDEPIVGLFDEPAKPAKVDKPIQKRLPRPPAIDAVEGSDNPMLARLRSRLKEVRQSGR